MASRADGFRELFVGFNVGALVADVAVAITGVAVRPPTGRQVATRGGLAQLIGKRGRSGVEIRSGNARNVALKVGEAHQFPVLASNEGTLLLTVADELNQPGLLFRLKPSLACGPAWLRCVEFIRKNSTVKRNVSWAATVLQFVPAIDVQPT
jgi:hypothetical protein